MTGQFRLRSVTEHIAVLGVSGNAKQRRKTMRHWKRLGYDPVRFYMTKEHQQQTTTTKEQ